VKIVAHPDVEGLEPIAGSSAQRHHLGTSVCDADLEVTVCVFLFENNADGLFDVDEETARWTSDALLVMRQTPATRMPVFLEGGHLLGVVTMNLRL